MPVLREMTPFGRAAVVATLVVSAAALVLDYLLGVHGTPIFIISALGILGLAYVIGIATERLGALTGPQVGGILNATFGNVAELIIALFVLTAGHPEVVKAQITGSILGNSLLGLGLGIVAGSWGREKQTFRREHAGLLSSLLILSVIALMLPALFDYTERDAPAADRRDLVERLSLGVSVVLILVYLANLGYTLLTHRDVFALEEEGETAGWPLWKALAVLVGATAVIAVEAEMVAGALEAAAGQLGLSTFFLGIIVLAVVGNAAEYISAVYFARRDRMGLVVTITVGSTIQVALFTAPLLVLISWAIGHPMNLVFSNPLELIAIAGVAFAVNSIAQDGETTWFEGVLLLAVYALFGLAFFYLRT
jgi:Ca2+:H+ antiporter